MPEKKSDSSKDARYKKQIRELEEQIRELEAQIRELEALVDESKSVFEVIPAPCGFAQEQIDDSEEVNDGHAIVIVRSGGDYDVVCTYFNAPCRLNCQILKTIVNGKQNLDLDEYIDFETDSKKD